MLPPRIALSGVILLATLTSQACATPAYRNVLPDGNVIRYVVVVQRDNGMDRIRFVDPSITDAIFLSPAAADRYYAGTGRAAGVDATTGLATGTVMAIVNPICIHCDDDSATPRCRYCSCASDSTAAYVGFVSRDAEGAWATQWVRPDRVGAVFLSEAAREQYASGEPIARSPRGDLNVMLRGSAREVGVIRGPITFTAAP